MGLRAVRAAPTRSISRPILRRIQKPFGHLFRDTPGINAPRCDKEGHGTRGDSEMAVQGLHDRFTHCEKAAQVLHGRFTHCERTVQVLHSPATHCERAVQVLHGHFTHCERAAQVLHSHFTHCERAVQVLHSHFTHCAGATHVLHTHFTHFADITQKGASGSLRACADSHQSRCLLDTIGIPPGAEARIHYTARESIPGHCSDLIGPLPLAPIFPEAEAIPIYIGIDRMGMADARTPGRGRPEARR